MRQGSQIESIVISYSSFIAGSIDKDKVVRSNRFNVQFLEFCCLSPIARPVLAKMVRDAVRYYRQQDDNLMYANLRPIMCR